MYGWRESPGSTSDFEAIALEKEYFMDERKRDSIIAYLRHRMEEFGIRPDDLGQH
jgi:hypothetical protein